MACASKHGWKRNTLTGCRDDLRVFTNYFHYHRISVILVVDSKMLKYRLFSLDSNDNSLPLSLSLSL